MVCVAHFAVVSAAWIALACGRRSQASRYGKSLVVIFQSYLCLLLGRAARGGINEEPNQTAPGTNGPSGRCFCKRRADEEQDALPRFFRYGSIKFRRLLCTGGQRYQVLGARITGITRLYTTQQAANPIIAGCSGDSTNRAGWQHRNTKEV